MKILFYGSHLKHYYLAKWLREKGHECILYLPDRNKPNRLPEWDNPALKNNYPDWIIEAYKSSYSLKKRIIRKLINTELIPNRLINMMIRDEIFPSKNIIEFSRPYDLVFTSAREYILPALALNLPVVFRAIGSDMSELPFEYNTYYQIGRAHV